MSNTDMRNLLDRTFMEMRWQCLSLAADLDRLERSTENSLELQADPRLAKLRDAIAILLKPIPNRAEQVQLIFSDRTTAIRGD